VGWLLQEGGIHTRLRACRLDDLTLADLARRAEQARAAMRTSERPTLRLVDGSA
jgi:hypothetical protein